MPSLHWVMPTGILMPPPNPPRPPKVPPLPTPPSLDSAGTELPQPGTITAAAIAIRPASTVMANDVDDVFMLGLSPHRRKMAHGASSSPSSYVDPHWRLRA